MSRKIPSRRDRDRVRWKSVVQSVEGHWGALASTLDHRGPVSQEQVYWSSPSPEIANKQHWEDWPRPWYLWTSERSRQLLVHCAPFWIQWRSLSWPPRSHVVSIPHPESFKTGNIFFFWFVHRYQNTKISKRTTNLNSGRWLAMRRKVEVLLGTNDLATSV